jgi:membrane-bound metal-dependent hydrolase YbcI (DUF457 family)
MMGRTHLATGVAAGLVVAAASGQVEHTPLLAYGLAGAAALLPDLDQHRSLASRSIANKPLHMILRHFRHRRFTHSLLGTAMFAVASLALWAALGALLELSFMFWVAGLAGWTSHLVADAFNKQGIHLFYPYVSKRIEWISIPLPRALRISTIYDPKGPPITLGRLQAYIPTELLFFKIPVYVLMAFVVWHQADALVTALRTDVWGAVAVLPDPVRDVMTTLLSNPASPGR